MCEPRQIDFSGFTTIDPQRFRQNYMGKVAKPQDTFIFSKASRKNHSEGDEAFEGEAVTEDDLDSGGHFQNFFEVISYLGEGGYAAVFRCQHAIDNHTYAIKKVGYNDAEFENTRNEVVIHARMDHKNVVRYYQSWTEKNYTPDDFKESMAFYPTIKLTHTLYLQMELCDGYLEDLMEKHEESKSTIYKYMMQIYQGVEHIHSKGVIHADISRSNILSSSGVLKIADFGKAKVYECVPLLVSEEDLGFHLYRAPETLKQEIFIDTTIDIYYAGLIYYEFVYLHNAFYRERIRIFEAIQSGSFPLNDEVSKSLLSINPENRPTASEAVLIFENLLANEISEQIDDEELDTQVGSDK